MYRPRFCCECAAKIIRLRWHFWTSRRFCDTCSRQLLRDRLIVPLIAGAVVFGIGLAAGRAARPALVPLVIERRRDSPLPDEAGAGAPHPAVPRATYGSKNGSNSAPPTVAEDVYICGARTRKGTPCSRRVHGPVRCWQHKGLPAMLPMEKLLIKK